ncbi:MAG: acetoacetate decarboxylase family protein [Actinomycetota bacterium]|nr:acetoacetate decarboxylase family protein [Actinomycetota bacterium]
MAVPPAPWDLQGECLVAVVRRPAAAAGLPAGLQPLPGWCVLVAARYARSPVGPYLELALCQPARAGGRAGLCVTTMVVDSPESRLGGRSNWGFPKELGKLSWTAEEGQRSLRWDDRGLEVRGPTSGLAVPVWAPVRALQRRDDGPVVVPGRLQGSARPGLVTVEVPADDALAPMGGTRAGAFVSGLRLVVEPARPA